MPITNTGSYQDKFSILIQQLNTAQQQAVKKIDGPVLVIAGPGTGKTQILAARIGNILLNTDTEPNQILCLTYTDAGVVAMRKRLFSFIGPDAYRVHLHTFHSFCNDIIQDNLDYFEKNYLDPISDLEQVELLQKLIDSFDSQHPLKRFRGEVYYELPKLKNLFSTMKRENWSPEFVSQKIDEYLNDLPFRDNFIYKTNGKTYKKGDLKQTAIDKEIDDMRKLRAAVFEFNHYQSLMKKANRYDFDDMILWVLQAFKNDPNFLLNYQERYLYVLVDEYQDTSGSQNELIELLMNYWDKPNIFVVGDDDQSIYRFQGASVENIQNYVSSYQHSLYRVMLTDNYRSSQVILDTARQLMSNKKEQLNLAGLDKNLIAKNQQIASLPIEPIIAEYPTQLHEFAHITQAVKQLIEQGTAPAEIAIIYKEHKAGEELARYFQLAQIPFTTKRKVDMLTLPFGKQLVNILRYIAQESEMPYSGDALLFEIMHYDFFHIPSIEIAKMSMAVNEKNRQGKNKTSIRRHIQELSQQTPKLFDTDEQQNIRKMSIHLEKWIKAVFNETLQTLFENVINQSGILSYCLTSSDKNWLMQILSAFFDFIKEETRRRPNMQLKQFIYLLEQLEMHHLRLELNQNIFNEQGVNLMTCHGSKGLEFTYVYVIGCNKNVWEGKKSGNKNQYKLPDNIFSSSIGTDHEELRRLFYVAITRAKTHLQLSYTANDAKEKNLEASQFLAEIMAEDRLNIHYPSVTETQLHHFFALNFVEQPQLPQHFLDTQRINEWFQSYVLSVTHLNDYLKCPLSFYFKHIVRVPQGKNENMAFGTAVHWSLNRLFNHMREHDNIFPDVTWFLDDFKRAMNRNKESFTAEQFERRLSYGQKILPAYYQQYIQQWHKIVVTERNVKNVMIQQVPIKGQIDKIEFNGNMVNVVDYKTGSYDNAKEKLAPPNEKNPLGGDYWRQAVFYKLLIDNDKQNDWTVVSAEFDFIEPDKTQYQKRKIMINKEDTQLVSEQITHTYQRLSQQEFQQGCGDANCHWCNFVKTNFK